MELFLLGNGFDLSHNLPTKYENFLHVVSFLIENYDPAMKTIGSVLGDLRLHKVDEYISRCYLKNGKGYDNLILPQSRILTLIEKAKGNEWFNYFKESFDVDIGWIDFEKEIAEVIRVFANFLDKIDVNFKLELCAKEKISQYIITKFNFFYDHVKELGVLPSLYTSLAVKPQYFFEHPKGSGNYVVSKERIIDELWLSLKELSNMLREYLCIFVDETIDELLSKGLVCQSALFNQATHVITFNYTHTYEKIYGCGSIKHIHGQADKEIVLGVNPDESDNLETVDTSFLQFKKYCQRVRYNTDIEYLQFLSSSKVVPKYNNGNRLIVVGHSLDVTDKDIITELFGLAKVINILYHSESAINTYIQNLVKIYGKEGFDKLRFEKKLSFLPLN